MKAGRDYIGVGVGAMIFNEAGQVFLAQRGSQAKNERGFWEFPGGSVEYGETLAAAIKREIYEEYGMEIEVIELLGVNDHILPDENQHWVSPTFIARHSSGVPQIIEPTKCAALGWFSLAALPEPLSAVSVEDRRTYLARYGSRSSW